MDPRQSKSGAAVRAQHLSADASPAVVKVERRCVGEQTSGDVF
jgi:hypothetical protein